MTSPAPAAPPPERFNFARHLLDRNRQRPDRIAYIDDHGPMSYATLDDRVRRMASALLAAGIRREERVLLVMHDCNDWPVAFLGAMYAGIVPVAVNTLATADDNANGAQFLFLTDGAGSARGFVVPGNCTIRRPTTRLGFAP